MWPEFLVQNLVTAALVVAAVQDARTREVSNWISLPIFIAGLVGLVVRRDVFLAALFALFVALAMFKGGYGPADGKILAGLTGLWPEATLLAVVLIPLFDLVWRRYGNDSPAPLIIPISGSTLLIWTIKRVELFTRTWC
jgi:Flp pilus assembly protein protease CpaA